MNDYNLPACPIFDILAPDETQELLARMRIETFPADRDILTESEEFFGLWIIRRGGCQVIKSVADGSEHSLAELGPGAIFGEMSFFQPAPNSATVRTVNEVEAWSLSTEHYAELEATAPRIAQKIAHAISVILAERLRRMDDWITQLLGRECIEKHEEWNEFRAKLYTNWDF